LNKYDKVVDDLADLSNIKPTVLDVSTMMDVTSSSFDDFDNFLEKSKKK
jgi:hypothetical protein